MRQNPAPVEFYEGPAARKLAGLADSTRTQMVEPQQLSGMKVFIQSTSVNRKLEKGTTFLIELNSSENCGP